MDRPPTIILHPIYRRAALRTTRHNVRRLHIICQSQRLLLTFTLCISSTIAGWIDMATPLNKRSTQSLVDGSTYHLVMSDEFNTDNRTFQDGDDPLWTALDKSDDDASSAGGGSMQFYNSTAVTTRDGFLHIRTYLEKTSWTHYDHVNKRWKRVQTNFTSGMVQSWNKFCFTGGIVEIDVVFPGEPHIGGLWPALWMLGNLGRATYEASTNNIWPWSYTKCDRDLQQAQTISACNAQNHYGLQPHKGRGATEIDVVEVMTGQSNGPLPNTEPPVALPYGDFTLQVAPGVRKNRPQPGALPLRHSVMSKNGHTQFDAQTWYQGLQMQGNTSINPFFYGTYLAKTEPNEPVTRTAEQAFQADAVGVVHQLTASHFERPHTFRVEWQPGAGGRLDWFVRSYRLNATSSMEGDGDGTDWVKAFTIYDASLENLMGSQIPNEPSYLIFNTAVSSTWGFPYDAPDWCPKCYDCDDPKCACRFYPGFCAMLGSGKVSMMIDSVRVYQADDDVAHVGAPHTLGCDPPGFPTKDWIDGHSYRYMRNPPFSYDDISPLRKVKAGDGDCKNHADCGSHLVDVNFTAMADTMAAAAAAPRRDLGHNDAAVTTNRTEMSTSDFAINGHGYCSQGLSQGLFQAVQPGKVCTCYIGFTGPNCLAQDHFDNYPSAHKLRGAQSPFTRIAHVQLPTFFVVIIGAMSALLVVFSMWQVAQEKRIRKMAKGEIETSPSRRGLNQHASNANATVVTRTSI